MCLQKEQIHRENILIQVNEGGVVERKKDRKKEGVVQKEREQ